MLPDIAQPVTQHCKKIHAAGQEDRQNYRQGAEKAVVNLISFDSELNVFCPMARQKTLGEMVSEK